MNFKVGDICVFREHVEPAMYRGIECTILALPEWMDDVVKNLPPYAQEPPGYFYKIMADGDPSHSYALESEMCLKKPPSDGDAEPRVDFTPGDWDLMPWRPENVTA